MDQPPTESDARADAGDALINARTLLAACGRDAPLLETMIRSFQTHARRHLAMIGDSIRERNPGQMHVASHKLRGLVSAFSSAAADAAGILERMGAAGELSHVTECYGRLAHMIDELYKALPRLTIARLTRQVQRAG